MIYSLPGLSRKKNRLFNLSENMFRKHLVAFAGGSQVNSHTGVVGSTGGMVEGSREKEVFRSS